LLVTQVIAALLDFDVEAWTSCRNCMLSIARSTSAERMRSRVVVRFNATRPRLGPHERIKERA